MGSATARRFALLAAILLLAPVWCRASAAGTSVSGPGVVVVEVATAAAAPGPAIRRLATIGGWAREARSNAGRGLVGLAILGLLPLLVAARCGRSRANSSAPSLLGRRRHVIALRAPPLRLCA